MLKIVLSIVLVVAVILGIQSYKDVLVPHIGGKGIAYLNTHSENLVYREIKDKEVNSELLVDLLKSRNLAAWSVSIELAQLLEKREEVLSDEFYHQLARRSRSGRMVKVQDGCFGSYYGTFKDWYNGGR